MVSYRETTSQKIQETTLGNQLRREADHYSTIFDLRPCTNYTYYVSAVSFYGLQGGTRTALGSTGEIEPSPVESVSATATGTMSISATWSAGQVKECVDHYYTCIRDADTLTSACFHTDDLERDFTGLSPCVNYEVAVRSVSPKGQLGSAIYDTATTKDVPTGAPQDLQVVDVTSHSATITFAPPATFPQCVHEYDTRIVDLSSVKKRSPSDLSSRLLRTQEAIDGLNACTDYGIWLSAATVSGFKSPEVSINFTTAEATPSAPRELNHTDVGADSVSLRWFAPENNTLCAVSYRVTWTSDLNSGSEDFPFLDHPFEVKVTVKGLTASRAYTFTSSALGPSGNIGPASEPCYVNTLP
ncbi:phosphatidylinositol phosphatase PTPRQ-like [Penaeus japonicus]|uniref:phosphatidylinositol phosphatase PTPRQ-like n=1 Tax=Penaeus japonicus TaxID=27405 RepID=UPI001C71527A|nr:phosphatidylinositol phosphatase PTPRQ-like [Penaeus japonicus]